MIASLLAIVLVAATPVAAGRPWQDWATWGPVGETSSRLAFDWMLNFPRLLDPKTDAQVMRVESPVASYWRANALDYFSGTAWLVRRPVQQTGSPPRAPPRARPTPTFDLPPGDPAPTGRTVTEVFRVSPCTPTFSLREARPRRSSSAARARVHDRRPGASASATTGTDVQLRAHGRHSQAQARRPRRPRSRLSAGRPALHRAALPDGGGGDRRRPRRSNGERRWRRRPPREWLGLYRLNREIVRGATDPYQITLRIEQYLRSHYIYSLTPPPSRYRSPYAAFLFDTKTGYCQHFAGAMAILERFNGIPARVAVGFTTGALVGRDTYLVRRTDAHAWVEVYFPDIGWTAFDPTPGDNLPGAGPSSTSAGFVDPFRQDRGPAVRPPRAPRRRSCRDSPAARRQEAEPRLGHLGRALDDPGLAALGARAGGRPARLAPRTSGRAPPGSASGEAPTAACAPRSRWSTPSSATTASACPGRRRSKRRRGSSRSTSTSTRPR